MVEANFVDILTLLARHEIKYILVGGGAGIAHGLARATYDVDVVYSRDVDNIQRLVDALRDQAPYLRGAPPGLPFRWDVATIQHGLNFTLTTSLGNLDLLGEITGGGTFEELLPHCASIEFHGIRCHVVTLERLILLKRAAGRPKDLEVIAELQSLLEERDGL